MGSSSPISLKLFKKKKKKERLQSKPMLSFGEFLQNTQFMPIISMLKGYAILSDIS